MSEMKSSDSAISRCVFLTQFGANHTLHISSRQRSRLPCVRRIDPSNMCECR